MVKTLNKSEITEIINETFSDDYLKGFHNGFDTGFSIVQKKITTYIDGFDDGLNCARIDSYNYFRRKMNRELIKYGIDGLSHEKPNIAIEDFALRLGTTKNHNLDEY